MIKCGIYSTLTGRVLQALISIWFLHKDILLNWAYKHLNFEIVSASKQVCYLGSQLRIFCRMPIPFNYPHKILTPRNALRERPATRPQIENRQEDLVLPTRLVSCYKPLLLQSK